MLKKIFFLALTMTLWSCSQGAENDPTKDTAKEQGKEYNNFNLQAGIDTKELSRAMAWDIKADGPQLHMTEEDMQSVIIITNKNTSTTYYAEITWKKTAGRNHLSYIGKLKDINTGNDIKISGSGWYIMGYVGGDYDKTAQTVKFNPNNVAGNSAKIQGVPIGKNLTKRVPVYFPWTELSIDPQSNNTIINAERNGQRKGTILFKPLGMMMRVQLTNEMDYSARYKKIWFQTNALNTNNGYYKIDSSSLPAIPTNTSTEVAGSGIWVPASATEPNYTFYTDANLSTAEDVVVAAKQTHANYYLVWAMPTTPAPTAPVTHLLAEAKRLSSSMTEEAVPKMNAVYIWGSTNMPQEDTKRILKTRLVRPKAALEFFSKEYVKPTDTFFNPYPNTDTNGISLWDYNQISDPYFVKAGWHIPNYYEGVALMVPVKFQTLKFGVNKEFPVPNVPTVVNGERRTSTEDRFSTSSQYPDVVYALRFDDEKKDQYSAWRYTKDANKNIKVECIVLGPSYKGSISDIAKESFWTYHQMDIIKREYPIAASMKYEDNRYYYYEYNYTDRKNTPAFWVKNVDGLALKDTYVHFMFLGIDPTDYRLVMEHFRHYRLDAYESPYPSIAPAIALEDAGTGWNRPE